ncbi:hypothetical protein Tco_1561814 [Tanacetum coccineum]
MAKLFRKRGYESRHENRLYHPQNYGHSELYYSTIEDMLRAVLWCSNLKKCLAKPDVQVPLDKIEIDENLRFVEEPIEIVERDVKKLKRRRSPWSSSVGTPGKERSIPGT